MHQVHFVCHTPAWQYCADTLHNEASHFTCEIWNSQKGIYYYVHFCLLVIRQDDGKDKKIMIKENRMIFVSEYDSVFNGAKTLPQPHTRKGAGLRLKSLICIK